MSTASASSSIGIQNSGLLTGGKTRAVIMARSDTKVVTMKPTSPAAKTKANIPNRITTERLPSRNRRASADLAGFPFPKARTM